VITPGMIIDEEFLDARQPQFHSAVPGRRPLGAAYLDISTASSASPSPAGRMPWSMRPAGGAEGDPAAGERPRRPRPGMGRPHLPGVALTYLDDKAFDYRRGYERLTGQFQTLTLEGFGCEGLKPGVSAAGALMHYVAETQKQKTAHITAWSPIGWTTCLVVDEVSRQNLELTATSGPGRGGDAVEPPGSHAHRHGGAPASGLAAPPAARTRRHRAPPGRGRRGPGEGRRPRELREQLKSVHEKKTKTWSASQQDRHGPGQRPRPDGIEALPDGAAGHLGGAGPVLGDAAGPQKRSTSSPRRRADRGRHPGDAPPTVNEAG